MTATLSRRGFLKLGSLAGAAFVLEALPGGIVRFADAAEPGPWKPNAWLAFAPDGRLTVVVARSEMGQGVRTSLPLLVARELAISPGDVDVITPEPGPTYDDMRTSGSDSIQAAWQPLRAAGATARTMFVTAAAARWNVPAADCSVADGAVVHAATGRKLSYGSLVADAAKLPIPTDAKPLDWRATPATSTLRHDGPAIVTGRAKYGLDVRVPGMKFAVIERAPTFGATLASFDAAAAKKVAGVRDVVTVEHGVAVVADSTWAALQGRAVLTTQWTPGPDAKFDSRPFHERLVAATGEAGLVSRDENGAAAAFDGAAKKFDAVYDYGFHAHAPMEPMNAIADAKADAVTIHVGTQAPNQVQEEVAAKFGYAPEKVHVVLALLGGGFGRRLGTDYAIEAVELSRKIGGPVQVMWTREDDMRHGFYQPASANRMRAALDTDGRIVTWLHTQASLPHNYRRKADLSDPDFAADILWGVHDNPYTMSAVRTAYVPVDAPMLRGPWRAVFYPTGVFARECFLDELAHSLGRDPVAYRLTLLEGGEGRAARGRKVLRNVLQVAADRAGWGRPRSDGRALGVAVNLYHGATAMAQIAEVSVDRDRGIRVHKFTCAVDCGVVVNPLGVAGQIESGIAWGLSGAMCGEITFKDGRAEQSSFADYPVLRFDQMPEVDVITVPSDVPIPLGIGEQPVAPVAAALGNALFAATGKRARRLPFRPEDFS